MKKQPTKNKLGSLFEQQMKLRQEEEEKVAKRPDRRSFKQKDLAAKFTESVGSPNENKDSASSGMESTPEQNSESPRQIIKGSSAVPKSPSDFDKMLQSTESEMSAHADVAENFQADDQDED